MPLLIHGEVTTADVDIFDKEAKFIEEVLKVSTRSFASVKRQMREGTRGESLTITEQDRVVLLPALMNQK